MSRRTRNTICAKQRQGISTENSIPLLGLHRVISKRLAFKSHFSPPMLSQIFPSRVHLLNQCDFLVPSPALQLPLTMLCSIHIVILLVINQPTAFIFFREPFNFSGLMLRNARINETTHSCIERTVARHDVDPESIEATFTHAANGTTQIVAKTPFSNIYEDAFGGPSIRPCFSRFAGSLVLAQDWAVLGMFESSAS